jgi:hypothetical protein
MLIVHYGHRLPADYDLALIRKRSRERGPVWDDRPDLHFKAFLLRESGRFGASANHFSSLYLWRQDTAFRDWLVRGGYKIVTDSFGRAEIDTRLTLDARRGPATEAQFLYRRDVAIPPDADLAAAFAAEIERNGVIAAQQDVVAAAVGLDARTWTFSRIVISEAEPVGGDHGGDQAGDDRGVGYRILHLARPLLDTLPRAAAT